MHFPNNILQLSCTNKLVQNITWYRRRENTSRFRYTYNFKQTKRINIYIPDITKMCFRVCMCIFIPIEHSVFVMQILCVGFIIIFAAHEITLSETHLITQKQLSPQLSYTQSPYSLCSRSKCVKRRNDLYYLRMSNIDHFSAET